MNNDKKLLIDLIKKYIECGEFFLHSIYSNYNLKKTDNILSMVRKGKIKKKGVICNDDGKILYFFHGIGCFFKNNKCEIDIDFSLDIWNVGFDLLRLYFFKESLKSNKYKIFDKKHLEKLFIELINEGVIVCPRQSPSNHLCFLSNTEQ